jgi:ATP-binding cassette subfamily B protein/subfamily B ATP-binding cassette protein MsbA
MSSFLRAVRQALRYRFCLLAAMVCSLLVGVLWGANIGALYPVMEVVFHGESLQQSLARKITAGEERCEQLRVSIDELRQKAEQAAPDKRKEVERELQAHQVRLQGEQHGIANARWQKSYADRCLPADPFMTMVVVIGAMALGTMLKSVFLVGNSFLVSRITQLTTFDIQNEFYARTLQLDLATFEQDRPSGLMSRFANELRMLSGGIQTLFGQAVIEPLKMIACLVGAAIISWRLLVLSLIVAPLGILLLRLVTKLIGRLSKHSLDLMAAHMQRLSESFHGIAIVKAFTMEHHERARFRVITRDIAWIGQKLSLCLALTKPVAETMAIGVVSIAVLVGAHLVLHQATDVFGIKISNQPLSPAALMAFFGFLAGIADPARKFTIIFGQIYLGMIGATKVYGMMDREPSVKDPPSPQPVPRPYRELTFRNVQFAYNPAEPVLREVELRIPFGETIAVIGPNGCGKSTLAKLIPRFYDPTGGAVELDGIDLRQFRVEDLRRQISVVTQNPWLFDDSIMDNIRYGDPAASDDEVIEAARKAHAHDFVMEKLEQGYETVVGEHGGRLSGGQRQRIALARAILRDPAILILDEATSEIDVESEQLIHLALADFVRGRTAIMITHRHSALALADKIVLMDRGRILDAGSHDQLIVRCPEYQRLQLTQLREAS